MLIALAAAEWFVLPQPAGISTSRDIGSVAFRSTARDRVPMSVHKDRRPLPDFRFKDADGRTLTLTDFRGKDVLLNIWATWCAPCRKEMPSLDRLQKQLGGPKFTVVAVAVDKSGRKAVDDFYARIGIEHLAKYVDASGETTHQLGIAGVPTTLLIDRRGQEVARRVGAAPWDSPKMKAFLGKRLAEMATR